MKAWIVAIAVLVSRPAIGAERIAAELGECPPVIQRTTIVSEIAISVITSLLGNTIDSLVQRLGSNQVETYSAVLPVADIEPVFEGKACLLLKSTSASPRKFQAIVKLETSGGALKPSLVSWLYPHDDGKEFLTERCRLFHQCQRRDVGLQLEVLTLATSFKDSTVAATPLQIAFADATAREIHDAFNGGDTVVTLPWTKRPEIKGATNLRFMLVETMQASAFAKALASAIDSQKAAILSRVGAKLDGTADAVAAQTAIQDIAAATKAQADYAAAWNAAKATKQAFDAQAGNLQEQNVLRASYALQIAAVKARRTLAEQAFKVAGIDWIDGLEALPDQL